MEQLISNSSNPALPTNMIVIVVDHQTVNVLVGTNLTKLNTNGGLHSILKNAGPRLRE